MRRLVYALPLLAFAAIAAWFLFGLGRDPSKIPSALIDKPVPSFALPPLAGGNGKGLASEDLHGRVALVNFFASWCAPCKIEHPLLMRLAGEKRVAVLGVSYKDQAAASRRFLTQLGDPFAAVGFDPEGRVAIDWGVYGVPETFVVDKRGRIRHRHVGPLTDEVLKDTLRPMIARLEKE